MPVEAPELVSKQPIDELYLSMDFTNVLGNNTISAITSVSSRRRGGEVSDLIIDNEVIGQNGKVVEFFVRGGTKFYTYRVEIVINTSNGQTIEGDGLLEVTG